MASCMEQLSYSLTDMYIWSPNMWSVFISYITFIVPHTLYAIGIIWSPHMYIWSSLTVYGTDIIWFPWHVHMVLPHMKCLHVIYDRSPIPCIEWVLYGPPQLVLYDSYGPPYLIWNGYCMVPQHVCMVPPCVKCLHVLYGFYSPHTLYGIGIVWSPPHVHMVPHMYYVTYGPHYLIWNRYCMVPYMYIWSPTCEVSSYLIWLMVPIPYME